MPARRSILAALFSVGLSLSSLLPALSQTPATPPAQTPAAADTASTPGTDRLQNTVAANTREAWDNLTTAVQDPKHADLRTQALAALGTLGTNAHASTLIVAAMKDPDYEVRSSAILAAGQTKNRNLTTDIRNMLSDKEPQVALAAATTLWKMDDRSGEDILIAVVNGDRKATASLKDSTMHTVKSDIHSPATLARIGALQGASILLGPFGFGITAYEYMRKNGGDSARALAVEQLSQEKTGPVRATILAALADKDPAVRAAAAKAVGINYHDKPAANALLPLFDDSKQPVRLTASAAYINATSGTPARPSAKTLKR
jgi:HEAT repeat protein